MTKETKCKHEYRLCTSTFGADQGAWCKICHKQAPLNIYKELKIDEQIERIKKL